MSNTKLDVLKQRFQEECKVINMKYEYNGYTGNEQWAIISELTEDEILEKYLPLLSGYFPFIVLTPAFGEVRDEFRRNEKKHRMRYIRSVDSYNLEDGDIELYHPELISNDFERQFFKRVEAQALHNAIALLKPIQKERLIKYYFEGKSTRLIAKDEGVSHQIVSKSISAALNNLKNFLK